MSSKRKRDYGLTRLPPPQTGMPESGTCLLRLAHLRLLRYGIQILTTVSNHIQGYTEAQYSSTVVFKHTWYKQYLDGGHWFWVNQIDIGSHFVAPGSSGLYLSRDKARFTCMRNTLTYWGARQYLVGYSMVRGVCELQCAVELLRQVTTKQELFRWTTCKHKQQTAKDQQTRKQVNMKSSKRPNNWRTQS